MEKKKDVIKEFLNYFQLLRESIDWRVDIQREWRIFLYYNIQRHTIPRESINWVLEAK